MEPTTPPTHPGLGQLFDLLHFFVWDDVVVTDDSRSIPLIFLFDRTNHVPWVTTTVIVTAEKAALSARRLWGRYSRVWCEGGDVTWWGLFPHSSPSSSPSWGLVLDTAPRSSASRADNRPQDCQILPSPCSSQTSPPSPSSAAWKSGTQSTSGSRLLAGDSDLQYFKEKQSCCKIAVKQTDKTF